MKNPDKEAVLSTHPFISRADARVIREIADSEGCDVCVFSPGDVIYSTEFNMNKLGYIISGKASVFSADNGREILLRQLNDGDITGVANLFNNNPFISRIVAVSKCKIMFINSDTLGRALEQDSNLMYAYINFLSDKIQYLNKKIVYLTAGSAERRLAIWLGSYADGDTVELPINISSLADLLNLGRASLYRAFDTLTEQGFIKKSGKTFEIVNRRGMAEKYS